MKQKKAIALSDTSKEDYLELKNKIINVGEYTN